MRASQRTLMPRGARLLPWAEESSNRRDVVVFIAPKPAR